jgi:hypothetical protein
MTPGSPRRKRLAMTKTVRANGGWYYWHHHLKCKNRSVILGARLARRACTHRLWRTLTGTEAGWGWQGRETDGNFSLLKALCSVASEGHEGMQPQPTVQHHSAAADGRPLLLKLEVTALIRSGMGPVGQRLWREPMQSRVLAVAFPTGRSWPAWIVLPGLTLACSISAVYGQTGPTAPDAVPPATSPAVPTEIQPGHSLPPATGNTAPTGPQSAVPAPLPPGAGADTPGGSARNGVIAPPGTPGGNPQVIPR